MSNEFQKPTKVLPAIVGQIADPDIYNQNIAAQSKSTIILIDEDGDYADGDIGDQTVGTIGALISNLKLRQGGFIKIYDAFGVFVKNVNFEQATESLAGTAEIATDAEAAAATDDTRFITPKKQRIIQSVYTQTGAVATGTTTTPSDDTKPQKTEGTEYMTLAITPTNASDYLDIEVVANGDASAVSRSAIALFKDSDSDALAVGSNCSISGIGMSATVSFKYRMVAGTTSAITFKVRIGQDNAGTFTFNGTSGGRKYGGAYSSSIKITQVKA
jgi:hypothetical protein